jgi:hypothetical protein
MNPLPLDYTREWVVLGIVTEEDIRRDEAELAKGEDPHPEHYRWRAFRRFIDAQRPLSAETARRLYKLGETGADRAMGANMMTDVLRHRECPVALFHEALNAPPGTVQKLGEDLLAGINDREIHWWRRRRTYRRAMWAIAALFGASILWMPLAPKHAGESVALAGIFLFLAVKSLEGIFTGGFTFRGQLMTRESNSDGFAVYLACEVIGLLVVLIVMILHWPL